MKKILTILIINALLITQLCGCGSISKAENNSVAEASETEVGIEPETPASGEEEEVSVAEAEASEESVDSTEEEMEDLSGLGDIEVENGIVFVKITVPATFADDATQEELDAEAGDTYTSAEINEDGSVTYKMTKKQHSVMLDNLSTSVDEAIQEMVDSEDYAFISISHNNDFTEFEASVSTLELGLNESFSVLIFYTYGRLYGIFSGNPDNNVIVNFYGPDGSLINTGSLNDMLESE